MPMCEVSGRSILRFGEHSDLEYKEGSFLRRAELESDGSLTEKAKFSVQTRKGGAT